MKFVIKGARVFDPSEGLDGVFDVLIEGGKISKIEKRISFSGKKINADGLYLFPGFIDIHAHLREPGEEYKEDLESGSRAAVKGGYTTVFAMPNTDPPIDNQELVSYIKKRSREIGLCEILPVGTVSKGRKGEELAEIGFMSIEGACAFTDDGRWVYNSSLMRRALEYSSLFNKPIISHAEDPTISKDGIIHEGLVSYKLGLKGIPREAEEIAVTRDILLSRLTGGHIHFAHISTEGALNLIRDAKRKGLRVTAEVTPHHLVLTDKAVESFDTNTKVNPPLREERDVKALIKGIKDGTVDAIATDHAPHSDFEKMLEYEYAPFGMIGLETSFPLLYTLLVKRKIVSLGELIPLFTSKPASVMNLNDRGKIRVGYRADLVLYDLEKRWKVEKNSLSSKSKNTPFLGYELFGKPIYIIFRGKILNLDEI
jgi:dihydroorotase